jgi:hypothetical protein
MQPESSGQRKKVRCDVSTNLGRLPDRTERVGFYVGWIPEYLFPGKGEILEGNNVIKVNNRCTTAIANTERGTMIGMRFGIIIRAF